MCQKMLTDDAADDDASMPDQETSRETHAGANGMTKRASVFGPRAAPKGPVKNKWNIFARFG